jgi:(E)-4-hydroxy-3-methylbut-2-enyl-diphosphate synthase
MSRWHCSGLVYRRRPTRTVHVGDITVGSEHPIRVQSMTTPSTKDTVATVGQIRRLVDAGCEIVRVTVPTTSDAENLPNIRRELESSGLRVPLVADIHFTPAAAMKAIEHVDKIRINPGNYADKKKFAVREYTDTEYDAELERIERVFAPLVERAKQLGVSMRIGTNHGSLSDRIMNRYGDSPEGMVESALEFVRICEGRGYRELILSMKSSNPVVVQQVYRLLAQRMAEEEMDYPFHLGVTEAGDGEDGRVKSALGIGALLDDGIGDTVRVSLTEDPVQEIPVAQALVEAYNRRRATAGGTEPGADGLEPRESHGFERRTAYELDVGPHRLGGRQTPLVEVPLYSPLTNPEALRAELDAQAGVRVPEETRTELVSVTLASAGELGALQNLRRSMELVAPNVALSARLQPDWLRGADDARVTDWIEAAHRLHVRVAPDEDEGARAGLERLFAAASRASRAVLVEADSGDGRSDDALELAMHVARQACANGRRCLMLTMAPRSDTSPLHGMRRLVAELARARLNVPLLLLDRPRERNADALIGASAMLGGLLCDGIGDSIQIDNGSAEESRRLAFGILQAARVRITRTEFISCPSCGRTLFDLEQTTARIKQRTAHLKGVKIAVMGCIVNGPGEMADADFGYVGWGEDKIALFVGKDMVVKDVPTAEADERLVQLIKEHGRWVEPPVPA